jgi:hypothetical protein
MSKITIQEIQEVLLPENWQVISTEYKNLDTELTFQCPEGHRVLGMMIGAQSTNISFIPGPFFGL